MEEFKEQVKKGFQACKADILQLQEENKELLTEFKQRDQEKDKLNSEMKELKSELKEIKELLLQRKEVKEENIPDEIQVEVPQKKEHKKEDSYEALLAYKSKINKRELLKQKMISLVGENGMQLAELKFLFVEHFKYCSKASFYNYLKELEIERNIHIERNNSQNTVYLSSKTLLN
jgi:uncharacterized membrane protein YheB (UPF0754 family)